MQRIDNLDDVDRLGDVAETTSDDTVLESALRSLVERHQLLNVGIGRGNVYWRARRCDHRGFRNEAEMSYPPAAVAGLGRCNDAQEPSLYLSGRRETALVELEAHAGEYFQLSGFLISRATDLRLGQIGETYQLAMRGTLLLATSPDAVNAISAAINELPTEEARMQVYIDAVLGGILGSKTARRDEYRLQRALLRTIYRKLPQLEGVIYPSTKHDPGINLAIRGPVASAKLESCCSVVVEILRARRHGIFDWRVLRMAQGVRRDNSYVWIDAPQEGSAFVYRVSPDEAERILV